MALFWIPFTLMMTISPSLSIFDIFTTGTSKLPRNGNSFAVGYDSSTDTILIFGGAPDEVGNDRQFVTFKDNAFSDRGTKYLTAEQRTDAWSQHYVQLGNELWIIPSNGASFVKIDTKTYDASTVSTTFPTIVDDGACLAGTDEYLFVIGGGSGSGSTALKTTQIYRLMDGQWIENVPSLHSKRMSLSCIAYGNKLYAIGGDDGSTFLESIETLDISNIDTISTKIWVNDWSEPLISARKATRVVVYGSNIYVIGGKDNNGNRVADINVIDTLTGRVSAGNTLNYATSYSSSIIVRNTLYVFGGYASGDWLNTYQYSTLPTKNPTATTQPPTHSTVEPTTAQPTTTQPTTAQPSTAQPTRIIPMTFNTTEPSNNSTVEATTTHVALIAPITFDSTQPPNHSTVDATTARTSDTETAPHVESKSFLVASIAIAFAVCLICVVAMAFVIRTLLYRKKTHTIQTKIQNAGASATQPETNAQKTHGIQLDCAQIQKARAALVAITDQNALQAANIITAGAGYEGCNRVNNENIVYNMNADSDEIVIGNDEVTSDGAVTVGFEGGADIQQCVDCNQVKKGKNRKMHDGDQLFYCDTCYEYQPAKPTMYR